MSTKELKSIKIPAEVHAMTKEIAKKEGRILESFTSELILEALKMRELKREQTPSGAAA